MQIMVPASEPFKILADDAVHLGRALEEYLQARDDNDRVCFLDFLLSRVGPFHPPVLRCSMKRCDDVDLPPDVEWQATDVGSRIGFAPSLPESFFVGSEVSPAVVRFTRDDPTARRLLDVVAEHLAPHVARNDADDAKFNLGAPWGKVQQKGMLSNDGSRPNADDPAEIEKSLRALVSRPESNRSESFRVGRALGRILAECHRYEKNFIDILDGAARLATESTDDAAIEDDDAFMAADIRDRRRRWRQKFQHDEDDDGFRTYLALGWRLGLEEALPELLEDPMLEPFFSNAATWLESEQQKLNQCDDPEDWPTEFRKLARVRAAVWLAFGEILHAARRSDGGARGIAPRMTRPQMLKLVRLTTESSVDKIRGALQFWQDVFEKGGFSVSPEIIVMSLSPCIEPLARRVWPDDFARQGPKLMVRDVLEQHLRSESELQHRFANTGLMLYKIYRNQSAHEFDRLNCTWGEAWMVFDCIRQLWEWSEKIDAERRRFDK